MSNKNAFEIRLEILKMAKELAMDEYFSKQNSLQQDYQLKVEIAKEQAGKYSNIAIPKCPTLDVPTPAEILQKSEELYKFVCN